MRLVRMQAGPERTVILSAMGSGINKCITVAEILKRRVVGLHQWNHVESVLLEVCARLRAFASVLLRVRV